MQKIDLFYILSLISGVFLGIVVMYFRLHIGPERISAVRHRGMDGSQHKMTWSTRVDTASPAQAGGLKEPLLRHLPNFFEALPTSSDQRIVLVNRLLTRRVTFMGLFGNYLSFMEVNCRIRDHNADVSCVLDFTEFDRTMGAISVIILVFMLLPIWGHFGYSYSAGGSGFLTFGNLLGYLIPSLVALLIPWWLWIKSWTAEKVFAAVDLAIKNAF